MFDVYHLELNGHRHYFFFKKFGHEMDMRKKFEAIVM
jgi:hypothetical protein